MTDIIQLKCIVRPLSVLDKIDVHVTWWVLHLLDRLSYADGYLSDDEESSEQIAPYIQMVSALVLQMIQAIVNLHLATPTGQKEVVQKPKVKSYFSKHDARCLHDGDAK